MNDTMVTSFQIIIEKMSFENNLPNKEGSFILSPIVEKKITIISEDSAELHLRVKIESTAKNAFPFNLFVQSKSSFIFKNVSNKEDIEKFMNKNAIMISFPYIRSAVTNLSATALVAPVILPLFDPSMIK